MSPTPRGATAAVLAALSGTILPVWLASVLLVIVLVSIGVDAWQVRREPRLVRTLPPILSRGVPAIVAVESDDGRSRIHQPSGVDIDVDPSEADGSLLATIVARRRGRHPLPAPATRTPGPLGLGRWHHRPALTDEIIVYPDLPAAHRLALDVRLGRFSEEGTRTRGPLGLGTDFESIREYRPDDDIRQVNWRATARTGTPMSNQYRVERDREIVCVVDAGRLMAAPVGDRTRLDVAVDVVAAMAAVAEEVGDRIGVVAFTDRVIRLLAPRRKGAAGALQAVYDLEPEAVDSDYERAFRSVAGSRRAFVLVLTDLLDRAAGAPLVAAVPALTRHHEVVVAGVVDENLERLLDEPARSTEEALRTAVAVGLIEQRRHLVAELRRSGAEVVDSPVPDLASHCVGAYLRARRRARL